MFCFGIFFVSLFRGRGSTLWTLKCYFVDLEMHISWQAQDFVDVEVRISWQARDFVDVEVQISWQAQDFVDLEMQIS